MGASGQIAGAIPLVRADQLRRRRQTAEPRLQDLTSPKSGRTTRSASSSSSRCFTRPRLRGSKGHPRRPDCVRGEHSRRLAARAGAAGRRRAGRPDGARQSACQVGGRKAQGQSRRSRQAPLSRLPQPAGCGGQGVAGPAVSPARPWRRTPAADKAASDQARAGAPRAQDREGAAKGTRPSKTAPAKVAAGQDGSQARRQGRRRRSAAETVAKPTAKPAGTSRCRQVKSKAAAKASPTQQRSPPRWRTRDPGPQASRSPRRSPSPSPSASNACPPCDFRATGGATRARTCSIPPGGARGPISRSCCTGFARLRT